MYFCIVLVIHHSEGVGSGFLGLYVFGWIGVTISDRETERSNILFRFSTAKFTLLQSNVKCFVQKVV